MEFTKRRPTFCVLVAVFILVFNQVNGSMLDFGNVTNVIRLAKEVALNVSQTWDLFANNESPTDIDGPTNDLFMKQNERLVLKKLSDLSDKVDAFEENEKIHDAVSFASIIRKRHQQNQLSNHLWELNSQITKVSRLYRTFRQYSKSPERYEESTITGFAWECVSPNDGMSEALEIIHSLIIPDKNGFGTENLLELVNDNLRDGYTAICHTEQSPQQSLYNLYNSIAITEIKGYMMTQFSLLLLKIDRLGNFTEEMEQTNARYEIRMTETIEAVRTAMELASQDLWKCDPSYHRDADASTELTLLVQGLIVNEVDLNGDGSCTKTCSYYNYARAYGCYDSDHCSTLRRCNGGVYNCQFIDSHMSVCPATRNSARRYDYIKYDNEQEYGKKETCSTSSSTINSWHRWFVHCSYCLCYCDDDTVASDRYFNLREVVADLESNKVITGVKFVKENQVIHLQIEQGELLERGRISHETEWKPVDAYSPLDYSVHEWSDYFKLSWSRRDIDLDELTAPPGYLVTGVRFRTLESHLNLEIRTTPFDFTTGVLVKNLAESTWHGNDNTPESYYNTRRTITLNEPDRSTHSTLPSVPNFASNRYIKFSPTDLKKDAAQSTVPFIDTQPVVPNPRIPITGVGIYHKGRSGFGGFIAPKLRTYNFVPHLHYVKSAPRPVVELVENEVAI